MILGEKEILLFLNLKLINLAITWEILELFVHLRLIRHNRKDPISSGPSVSVLIQKGSRIEDPLAFVRTGDGG